MPRGVVVVCLVCLVAGAQPAIAAGIAEQQRPDQTGADGPSVVELYPNPPTGGDPDEFVTVCLPPGTSPRGYELSDGHTSVPLGTGRADDTTAGTNASAGADTTVGTDTTAGTNATIGTNASAGTDTTAGTDTAAGTSATAAGPGCRRLTFSGDVERTASLTERKLASLPDGLALANNGERLELRRGGETVDTVGYDRAPEGEVYDAIEGVWRPLGATDLPVTSARGGTVEAFVLPDAGGRAVELLEGADDRILLAGYTLTSPAVEAALRSAHERGVSVEVLVDGAPIGGTTGQQATTLDTLERAGIPVHVLDGEHARYRHHHAKYAVVDGQALVTSENWKPPGVGGHASRGWGVVTDQRAVVSALVELFRADADWVDTVAWSDHDPTLVRDEPARGTFPAAVEPEQVAVERTSLLVAPDNARRELQEVIRDAEESIDILQVSVDEAFSLLTATIDTARRGVEVRLLLSGAWYTREENGRLVDRLEQLAERSDLPLSVRLIEPGGAFDRLHAKGLVVDGDQVYVGSLNWNEQAATENREVGLLLEGEAVGAYFRRVFDADWRRTGDEAVEFPLGVGLVVLGGVVVAVLAARRIRFVDDGDGVGGPGA